MRNFIIFFQGKEGTSPLVRLLNNFERISIIHPTNKAGWEPFDAHNCGPMPQRRLKRCLEGIFDKDTRDFNHVNRLYTRTSIAPLEEINYKGVVGFKMRFTPPTACPPYMVSLLHWNRLTNLCARYYSRSFKRMMFKLLRRKNVVVFLIVRQDVFRWGLSRYHGDGTGKPGHIQFKIARGEINRGDIPKIHVDCKRLGRIIKRCERIHSRNRHFMKELKNAGIQTHFLRYEDFLADKQKYFRRLTGFLELNLSDEEIHIALSKGAHFKKVHSDDISEFVVNHEEVRGKFGNRFVGWD